MKNIRMFASFLYKKDGATVAAPQGKRRKGKTYFIPLVIMLQK